MTFINTHFLYIVICLYYLKIYLIFVAGYIVLNFVSFYPLLLGFLYKLVTHDLIYLVNLLMMCVNEYYTKVGCCCCVADIGFVGWLFIIVLFLGVRSVNCRFQFVFNIIIVFLIVDDTLFFLFGL